MAIDGPILTLGSCFSTEIGSRMKEAGHDILVNPFGVLYNPASIAESIRILADPAFSFTEDDVIERDPYYCARRKTEKISPLHRPIAPCIGGYTSFRHHGSFTRATPEEFLRDANASLGQARDFYHNAGTIIVTFGTAWIYRLCGSGLIVSNCHKHRPDEFIRERLSVGDIVRMWSPILGSETKHWIFTVSPIRHTKDGLHGNQISKSTLLMACEELCAAFPGTACYFPSYEIMMDELRDYRWYAPDGVHPSPEAVDIIFRRFCGFIGK